MSIFKFQLNNIRNLMQQPKANTDAYLKAQLGNLKNAAMQAGQTTAVALAKEGWYKIGMDDDEITSDFEALLGNGYRSPYKASANAVVRNTLVFNDEEGNALLAIVNAKINVTQENVIVKTPLTGKRGTVKEFIQASDYKFDITGSLISDVRNAFPLEDLGLFLDIMKTTDVLHVTNVFMYQFLRGDNVVMESYSLDQQSQKYVNIIDFKLTLISDQDLQFATTTELPVIYNSLNINVPGETIIRNANGDIIL